MSLPKQTKDTNRLAFWWGLDVNDILIYYSRIEPPVIPPSGTSTRSFTA
ncbi:MAG: hypothetical protein WD022_03875 [Balneolaceae bacterium]